MEIGKENLRKAYKELYEIIKKFSQEDKNKIPNDFILSIKQEMDKDYEVELDFTKDLSEQNIMAETKAMLVNLYKMYFANEEEKIFFQKYDKLCFEKVEKQKREKYDPNAIFKKPIENKDTVEKEEIKELMVHKNFVVEIFDKIKRIIKSIFNN